MARTPASEAAKEAAKTKALVEKYVVSLTGALPLSTEHQKIIEKAAPILGTAASFIVDKLIPFLYDLYLKLLEFWKKLEPYRPDLLLPGVCGLIMVFFGGNFLTIIAAVEAYRMSGYQPTVDCIKIILEDMKKVVDENKKDDAVDADGDGVADVLQVSSAELVKRKSLLFLRVADPRRLTDAVAVISLSFFAVVSTLKLQFAKTITLGCAIGDAIEKPALKYALPLIEKFLPAEYKKWAHPCLSYVIKSIAVSIAWFVQRVLSCVHSATRGGLMFSRNILSYLSEMGFIRIEADETLLDEIVGYGFALIGIWFQLSMGFSLPFPMNILLFPVSVIEYSLMWIVNSK